MLRGLLRPKWIAVHLGVAAMVVLMVTLGFWQLRRLDEKRQFNAVVTTRSQMPVEELGAAVNGGTGADALPAGGLEWRRVSVQGSYDFTKAVRVVNRSQDGMAGFDQVVPLRTEEFGWVIVNRGFVPLAVTVVPSEPAGRLTVAGYLRLSQKRGALGAVDSTDTSNRDFQRFDIPLMSRQLDGETFPMYVQMVEESPRTESAWPTTVAFPELSEGPHQSYAVQWFFFSCVALAAWAVVVRRKWRAQPATAQQTPA